MLLAGKVALITGAAQGIGLAIAERFAAEGATVALCDMNLAGLEKLIKRLPPSQRRHSAHQLDVGDPEAVGTVVEAIIRQHAHIDILVNNAGIFIRRWLLDIAESEWDQMHRINTKGPFLLTQAVGKHMVKRGEGGKIINIGSISGQIVQEGKTHYSTSKAALIHFSLCMAVELGPFGINVNVVCPGPTDTPQIAPALPEDYLKRHSIPLGRLARPEDHANAALFLASSASDHITGQVLNVDGGELATRIRPGSRLGSQTTLDTLPTSAPAPPESQV